MTTADHLLARRRAQAVEKLARRVRWLLKKHKLTEAQVALSSFSCGDIVAVPRGQYRHLAELRGAADELRVAVERLRS